MAMFAIGVAAATAQVATMNLSGSVPAELNGKKMYIINLDTRERIDSAVVKNGKTVKLSDYVGKGDYVVLDFFASWCGPCRREMPTLKGIYEKYNGKGLKVVGLAVWDEPADTKKCVKELALPWTIIDNAQSEATEIYGVSGIPHIIVFAPDGTILARDLRGNDLAAKVDELLAK